MGTDMGHFIKERRQAKEISLRELARRIGKSPAYIVSLERSESHPGMTDATLAAIARELDADPDQLHVLLGRVPAAFAPTNEVELALMRLIKTLPPGRQETLRRQIEEEVASFSAKD